MIRVLIVDDHDFVRAGIAGVLGLAGDIEVVGECTDGMQVVSTAEVAHPQVVLMDIRMPKLSGIDATRALIAARPSTRVLILTTSTSQAVQQESARAGASGFLVKRGDPGALIAAVRTLAGGGTCWPADGSC